MASSMKPAGATTGSLRLRLLGGDDTERAAEVVDVAVGEHDRGNRLVAEVFAGEGQRGGGRLPAGQGVDDDPARPALDQGHVGEVEAAQLPDAVGHLEQADVVVEQGLAPEAGVHRGRCRALDEIEGGEIPDDVAGFVPDLAAGRGDEAALGVGEGRRIGKVGALGKRGIELLRRRRRVAAAGDIRKPFGT